MIDKSTQIFLKNGLFRIDTQIPYVVDIKVGNDIQKCHVVYHATYHDKTKDEEYGTCCWIKHETIVRRSLDQFKKIEDWEALIVSGEVFSSTTGCNMSIEDDDEK